MIENSTHVDVVLNGLEKDEDFQKQFPLCFDRLERLITARITDLANEKVDNKAERIEACGDLLQLMRQIPTPSDRQAAPKKSRKRLNHPA